MSDQKGALALVSEEALGPPEVVDPKLLARIAEDAILDRQIAALAANGVNYPQIAELLSVPLSTLLARIGSLLNTRSDIMSSQMMDDYLIFQLRAIDVLLSNAQADMDMRADEERGISEADAAKARHNGRLAFHKALQQQATVMGLIRQRVDIRQAIAVKVSVVKEADWEAL